MQELIVTNEERIDSYLSKNLDISRSKASKLILDNVLVNGKKVDIPSYITKVGDVISVKENSLNHPAIIDALEQNKTVPAFLEMDKQKLTGKYLRTPERSELNPEINEQLIVEFYNR